MSLQKKDAVINFRIVKLLLNEEADYYTLWITPKLAVAVNFAQLVALASHSKFSLQNQINILVRFVKLRYVANKTKT